MSTANTVTLTVDAGFDTLLPMTFPVEDEANSERLARQGMVLQSKISNPAAFLGFMATVAAHRAILRGHHKDLAPSQTDHDDLITDPDYKKVKHEAIVAVRQSIQSRQKADQYLIDACFGLVSTATVIGNFDEARMHLNCIFQMISAVGASEESMSWLPVTLVKLSTAMLSQPSLTIPWTREDIPNEILQRISPRRDTEQARLGTGFVLIPELSDQIKSLLSTHRDVCNICEFSATHPGGLSALENSILIRKAIELEYDYVAYPYQSTAFRHNSDSEALLPAFEAVVRLAGLGLLSTMPHAILPSSGPGRAITHHQKRAVERWLHEKDDACGIPELRVITWALFIFIQRSEFQVEQVFFTQLLAHTTRELWLLNWGDVETTIYSFLYTARLQATIWQSIWYGTQATKTSRMSRAELTDPVQTAHGATDFDCS
ncbi:hypothetical protein LTR41_011604 [Exophiala xenobiotica]|nr:hypothetical protein LTR41_011604 [Exophiala xenobiotica]KAK5550546.1 hypothetical protein LTR46_011452 [Exophiala xenobiotica]